MPDADADPAIPAARRRADATGSVRHAPAARQAPASTRHRNSRPSNAWSSCGPPSSSAIFVAHAAMRGRSSSAPHRSSQSRRTSRSTPVAAARHGLAELVADRDELRTGRRVAVRRLRDHAEQLAIAKRDTVAGATFAPDREQLRGDDGPCAVSGEACAQLGPRRGPFGCAAERRELLLGLLEPALADRGAAEPLADECRVAVADEPVELLAVTEHDDRRERADVELLLDVLVHVHVELHGDRVIADPADQLGIDPRRPVHLLARTAPGRHRIDDQQLVLRLRTRERGVEAEVREDGRPLRLLLGEDRSTEQRGQCEEGAGAGHASAPRGKAVREGHHGISARRCARSPRS